MASDPDKVLNDFKPNSGTGVGLTGLVGLGLLGLGVAITEPNALGFTTLLVCSYLALLVYCALLRPRARATAVTLLLRNGLSQWVLPLRHIDTVAVRNQLYVWIGEEKYHCAGLGRSARSMMSNRGSKGGALAFLGIGAEVTGGRSMGPTLEGTDYLTFIERRISELAHEAARDHPDVDFDARLEWSWPLVGAVIGGLVLVVAVLVA